MIKNIITSDDIEAIRSAGKQEIKISPKDIVTDEAKEKAQKLNVKIEIIAASVESTREDLDNMEINRQKKIQPVGKGPRPLYTEEDKIEKKSRPLPPPPGVLEAEEETAEGLESQQGPEDKKSLGSTDRSIPIRTSAGTGNYTIRNGQVVIPSVGIKPMNLEIKNHKIHSLTEGDPPWTARDIDAAGLHVLPGIIDPHVHLGIFGSLEEEMYKETRSALLGGVTSVGCFINSENSHKDDFPKFVNQVEKNCWIDLYPHFSLTNTTQIQELPDYGREFGINTFKVYMCGIPGLIDDLDDRRLLEVFDQLSAVSSEAIVMVHAENPKIVEKATEESKVKFGGNGLGMKTLDQWAGTRPGFAEENALKRIIALNKYHNLKLYFVHVSSEESVTALENLPRTSNVYAETTSPYLTLTTDGMNPGTYGKMIPPLRDTKNNNRLWEGINNGMFNTVGTDNTTIKSDEKQVEAGMWEALPGYPTLATHLPSMLSEGVNKGKIDLVKLSEVMSGNVAKILGIYPKKGTLLAGSDADLTLIDLTLEKEVKPERLESRSDFSLFQGQKLTGWPIHTIKGGQLVVQNGEITGQARGKVIRTLGGGNIQ